MNKNVLPIFQLLSNQTLASSFYSQSTNTQYFDRACYSITWTGTPVGSLIVQGSLDNSLFSDLDMNPIIMSGASDTAILDIQTTALPYLRLSYTATSGTGSMNASVSGKES